MLLEGKAAVVTGAGQGIGAALARALAAEGALVVANDIDQAKAEATAAAIRAAGGTAVADPSDVSTFGGADAVVDACVHAYGRIDVMVNNAGILRDRMSFNMSQADWDAVIAVCLTGTFACARAAVRWMRAEQVRGRIINVSSRAGLRGSIGQANYAAAKAGVLGLTRSMSQEVVKYGITVNAIVPRAVTDMTDSIPADRKAAKDASWAGSAITLRGTPEQVAPAVIYLASEEADWVNGQVIGIAGDKLSIWTHPSEAVEAFMPGGWSLRSFRELFRATVGTSIQTLGPKD
ncbi:MAG: SDR family oxidoreductase [Burkholderiaceae bacterium]|nr:SDR family oxidoreductase [Burkholderiaceae bacterium]MEB2317988.1 SDR family oxidoreductase [Pseudomonadota bacterium]